MSIDKINFIAHLKKKLPSEIVSIVIMYRMLYIVSPTECDKGM